MRAVHDSHPSAQGRTVRRSYWIRRVAGLIAALALVVGLVPTAVAQSVEIAYNTFLDPNNANDPRAAAQTKMIAEFERLNPNIKVRVVVDPTGANGARTLRTKADSPDVIRATSFQMPEYVATGSLMQLDDLVARDKIDANDWLRTARQDDGTRPYLRPPAGLPDSDPDLPQASARRGESDAAPHVGRRVRHGREADEAQRRGLRDSDRNYRRHRRCAGIR